MDNINKALAVIKSTDGLQQIFSIFLVALILTVFEVGFFYLKIVPDVKKAINKHVDELAVGIARNLYDQSGSQINKLVPEDVITYLNFMLKNNKQLATELLVNNNSLLEIAYTMRDRETLLRNKINRYTMATCGILIAVMVGILAFVVYTIKSRGSSVDKSAIISAVITVGILIAFQYNFYLIGTKYSYIGSKGKEEFIKLILDTLEETS